MTRSSNNRVIRDIAHRVIRDIIDTYKHIGIIYVFHLIILQDLQQPLPSP